MKMMPLPKTVESVLGQKAARDLTNWFDEQLRLLQTQAAPPISAFVARQKVNVLLLEQVSNLLLAGEPSLVWGEDERDCWEVPVHLTLPTKGIMGQVGVVRVDALRGELLADQALLAQIEKKTADLMNQISR